MNAPVQLPATDAIIDPAEVAQIELYILRRMREVAPGDHASIAAGSGLNLVGLRNWEPGDPISSVDWAQSSLTNFSPLVSRQFEEDRNANVLALVDVSQSTLCGPTRHLVSTGIARAVAAIGFSAAFFQDAFGLVSFGDRFEARNVERMRRGRGHVLHCLQQLARRGEPSVQNVQPGNAALVASNYLTRPALMPVISDFMFPDAAAVIEELATVNALHDVLLVIIDARLAFELPSISAGWVEVYDVESGRTQVLSRNQAQALSAQAEEWQRSVEWVANANGLEVVRLGTDRWECENAMAALVAERRVRKVRM